jgi:signal transduction histidine kinase
MLIVVRNLLSNAIKFTPNGGKIIIRGSNSLQEKYYQLKIFDTGTGIDKDKVKHLFNVSHQQLIGNNRSTGAGLGLTLVKEFIYLNGCTI